MTVLAIDPGLSGAAAVLDSAGEVIAVVDLPVAGTGAQRRIDAANLAAFVRQHRPVRAVIEQVGARPGQGVSSMFRFGQAVGTVAGVVAALAVPVQWVTPGTWKRALGLGADKEQARQRALERWPAAAAHFARKADHGRAEAALIGLWAVEKMRPPYRGDDYRAHDSHEFS